MPFSSNDLILIATILLLIATLVVAIISIIESRVLARELRITALAEMFQEMALSENRRHRYEVMDSKIIDIFKGYRNPNNTLSEDVGTFFQGKNGKPVHLQMGITDDDVETLYSNARSVAIIYDRMAFLLTRLEASFSGKFKADFYRLWGDDLIIGWERIGFLIVHVFRRENTDRIQSPERVRYSRYFEHITEEAIRYEEELRRRGEDTLNLLEVQKDVLWVDPRKIKRSIWDCSEKFPGRIPSSNDRHNSKV